MRPLDPASTPTAAGGILQLIIKKIYNQSRWREQEAVALGATNILHSAETLPIIRKAAKGIF